MLIPSAYGVQKFARLEGSRGREPGTNMPSKYTPHGEESIDESNVDVPPGQRRTGIVPLKWRLHPDQVLGNWISTLSGASRPTGSPTWRKRPSNHGTAVNLLPCYRMEIAHTAIPLIHRLSKRRFFGGRGFDVRKQGDERLCLGQGFPTGTSSCGLWRES